MKTLVIVNDSTVATFFKDYEEEYNRVNREDSLSVVALLDLPIAWHRGIDRVVMEEKMSKEILDKLASVIKCEGGWTTVAKIVENGEGNDEFFELAVSIYILGR